MFVETHSLYITLYTGRKTDGQIHTLHPLLALEVPAGCVLSLTKQDFLSAHHLSTGRTFNVDTSLTAVATYGNIFPHSNKLSSVHAERQDGLDSISGPPALPAEPGSKL